jgi:hypothetical protein
LQAFADRAAEIVRIWDEHEAAERAAKEHPSVLAAQAQQDETYRRWCELATRLATMPAKTSEGLIAKLALIASAYADDEPDGTYDGILASVARDALTLTG